METPQEPQPQPVETHDLIKSQEELQEEAAKQNIARLKLMVFLGTIIVMIIVSAYVLKAGKQMQGNLANIIEPQENVSAERTIEFCPIGEYRDSSSEQCQSIDQTDCKKINELKIDPIKYDVDPDTIKQEWWQEECSIEEDQTETEPLPEIAETEENEQISDSKESNSEEMTESSVKTPLVAEQPVSNLVDQPLDCGKAKADASILTDKGFVDKAFDMQNTQLTSPECHAHYGICQVRLASAVAAQSYMTFAESIRRSTVYLQSQFDQNADAFYGDPSCFNTEEQCLRIKSSGLTKTTGDEELPLSLIAPASTEDKSSNSEPQSGVSPFSQESLEYNIDQAINDNTIFTDKEFYDRYCAPKQTTEQNNTQPSAPPKVKRAI